MYKIMKFVKVILACSILVFIIGVNASAQTANMTVKPKFDAELAKKLGADKNGMRNYVLAILKTGPTEVKDAKERGELFKGHMANINRLAAEGKLAVAGPFGKNTSAFRGIFILAVATVEEAKALTDTDPVIKSGMMVVDLYPWFGSAALMETNNIHGKIALENF